MTIPKEISIVVPVYNEEENLRNLYQELVEVLRNKLNVSFEVIFIDDGSKDHSWELIQKMASEFSEIKGFRFSRNFGHQYAIKAGIDYAEGQAIITIDADLQHPPAIIEDFYRKWKDGFDIVYSIRKNDTESGWFKNTSSSLFYHFLNSISDIKLEKGSADFRLLDRKVVEEIKKIGDYHLFIRGIVQWVGFKSTSVEYNVRKREKGESGYTLKKMLKLAQDGIMSFSVKPLRLATLLGFLISAFSFGYIVYALLAKFAFHNALPGWTSILISVLFLGGIQLLCIGIIGEYIGKIFIQVKNRPSYIISEKIER